MLLYRVGNIARCIANKGSALTSKFMKLTTRLHLVPRIRMRLNFFFRWDEYLIECKEK
jgi:hypothetical protein